MNISDFIKKKLTIGTNNNKKKSTCISKNMKSVHEKSPSRHVLPVCGGTPITEPTAVALRQTVFGQCPELIRAEYFSRGPGLVFRDAERELGYGLMIGNAVVAPMVRSLLMAIQGHVLRSLLFHSKPPRATRPNPLRPTKQMQQDALCTALADVFWKAGGSESCTVCLPHPIDSYVQPSDHFNEDGVTERLLLFPLAKYEDILSLLRRYIHIFQEDPGPALLLVIYSSVLSRGIDRICEDLGHRLLPKNAPNLIRGTLLCYSGKIIYSTLCLLLTGRATPFLHNGIYYEGSEDQCAVAQVGITCRSPLGLLIWMGNEERTAGYRIGSRLKTPIFPIWICIVADSTGVLFSCDRELMRDYRAENKFDLHYYTSSHHQLSPVVIGVVTKHSTPLEPHQQTHPLEKIIATKYSRLTRFTELRSNLHIEGGATRESVGMAPRLSFNKAFGHHTERFTD